MNTPVPADALPKSYLEEISTRWAIVRDPIRFVLRYAPAIEKYLGALVRNSHDADEIAQEFLLKMMERRFDRVGPDGGRFRFYLKQAVRNAVREHARRKRPAALTDESLSEHATDETAESLAERKWADEWRRCLLDRAWSALESYQHGRDGNLYHTVLRLTVENPDRDSASLAELASHQNGRRLTVEAFRQQVSRGRRLLAKLVWDEAAATLERPDPDEVEEELTTLGLMEYIGDYLRHDSVD